VRPYNNGSNYEINLLILSLCIAGLLIGRQDWNTITHIAYSRLHKFVFVLVDDLNLVDSLNRNGIYPSSRVTSICIRREKKSN
jgi:hypothetical protein